MRGVLLSVLLVACSRDGASKEPANVPSAPPPAPVATSSKTAPVVDNGVSPESVQAVRDQVKRLADVDQKQRDDAAARIRAALEKEPAASGDPGAEHWKAELARLPKGLTAAEVEQRLGATREGAVSSGQSTSMNLRLDDHWVVVLYLDRDEKLREVGPLKHSVRYVWVQPPEKYTGRWVTYFVNGRVHSDIDYDNGTYRRFTAFYANGQKTYEQRYVNGQIDGPEVGYHESGAKAYEQRFVAGKKTGRAVHWYENGKLQSEQSYVNGELDGSSTQYRENGTPSSRIDYRAGKETGQAAWDESGALLYARGTAKSAKPAPP